jgi:hypothetical protein
MSLARVISVLSGCVILVGCSSSTTAMPPAPATVAQAPAAAAPAAEAVAVEAVPMPTSSPTGKLDCANFDQMAARLKQTATYASINVGTNNDTGPAFGDMNEAMGVLTAMAPTCSPDAVAAIAALGAAAGNAAAVYKSGDDPAVIAADKAALTALGTAGKVAWKAMGLDPATWDLAVQFFE